MFLFFFPGIAAVWDKGSGKIPDCLDCNNLSYIMFLSKLLE